VRAFERKIGLVVMIESGLFPGCRRVAVATLLSMFAIVHVRVLMASVTVNGSVRVFLVGLMAGIAVGFAVLAL